MTPSSWYPLLRRLHAAGWEHKRLGVKPTSQILWRRGGDQITSDELLSVEIGGVSASAAGLDPVQCDVILTEFGAFEPGSVAK